MSLLSVQQITMRFGGLTAVDRFSFALKEGDLVGLIGPNGAGKTTVFNIVSGNLKPTEGKILFQGKDIAGLRANLITRRGIARTFQNIRLFQDMTVLENVMVGCHRLSRAGLIAGALQFPWTRTEEKVIRQKALEALKIGRCGKDPLAFWAGSAWTAWPGKRRAPWLMGNSEGLKSPGPWPRSPRFFCSTSRRRE